MKLKKLAKALGVKAPNNISDLVLYSFVRKKYFEKFNKIYLRQFQSPSITPTTHIQRSDSQITNEHSVYQRSDYTPLRLEDDVNSLYKNLKDISPRTATFNSGMAAISSLAYFLFNVKKISKLALAENSYFETDWLMKGYGKTIYFDEYKLNLSREADAYWIEFPVNCTKPDKYPFDQQINLQNFFKFLLRRVATSKKQIYLVIDYTLFYLPFNIDSYISELPEKLSIFLISSLQKHRGYGLDLTNGGVITYYSREQERDCSDLLKIRAITGTSITQETVWLMPKIDNKLINQIVKDSGLEAKKMFESCYNPKSKVRLYYSNNNQFLTSFIFMKIDDDLMKKSIKAPFYSDKLIGELVNSAKRNQSVLICGTSFGFPFTRIFKNSERYDNTNSLRIAVGYDSVFNKNLGTVISAGIKSFIDKYQ